MAIKHKRKNSSGYTWQGTDLVDGQIGLNTADGTAHMRKTDGSITTIHKVPPGGTAGQVLSKVDGTDYNTHWATVSGSASALNDLTDVTITTPSTGQVLSYDGNTWVNADAAGGSIVEKTWFGNLIQDPHFKYISVVTDAWQVLPAGFNTLITPSYRLRSDSESLASVQYRDLSVGEAQYVGLASRSLMIDRYVPTVSSARCRLYNAYIDQPALFAGKKVTKSFYAKGAIGGEKIYVMVGWEANNGAQGHYPGEIITLSTNWQRFELTFDQDPMTVEHTTGYANSFTQIIFVSGTGRYDGVLANESGVVEIANLQVEVAGAASEPYAIPAPLYDIVAGQGAASSTIGFDSEDQFTKTANKNIVANTSGLNTWESAGFVTTMPTGSSYETAGFLRGQGALGHQANWQMDVGAYGYDQKIKLQQVTTRGDSSNPINDYWNVLTIDPGFYEGDYAMSWIQKTVTISYPLLSQPGGQTGVAFTSDPVFWSLLSSDLISPKLTLVFGDVGSINFVDPTKWQDEIFTSSNLLYGSSWRMELVLPITQDATLASYTVSNFYPSGTNFDASLKRVDPFPSWLSGTTATVTRPTTGVNIYKMIIENHSGLIEISFVTKV